MLEDIVGWNYFPQMATAVVVGVVFLFSVSYYYSYTRTRGRAFVSEDGRWFLTVFGTMGIGFLAFIFVEYYPVPLYFLIGLILAAAFLWAVPTLAIKLGKMQAIRARESQNTVEAKEEQHHNPDLSIPPRNRYY